MGHAGEALGGLCPDWLAWAARVIESICCPGCPGCWHGCRLLATVVWPGAIAAALQAGGQQPVCLCCGVPCAAGRLQPRVLAALMACLHYVTVMLVWRVFAAGRQRLPCAGVHKYLWVQLHPEMQACRQVLRVRLLPALCCMPAAPVQCKHVNCRTELFGVSQTNIAGQCTVAQHGQ